MSEFFAMAKEYRFGGVEIHSIEDFGENHGMKIFRSIAPKFFQGFPNAREIRTKLVQNLDSIEYLENTLKSF